MAEKDKKQPKVQKCLVAVSFYRGDNEDGGTSIYAKMDVEYNPKMPMLDKHKRNFGVEDIQAAAASLPSMVERALEAKGYQVEHPGKDNKPLQ